MSNTLTPPVSLTPDIPLALNHPALLEQQAETKRLKELVNALDDKLSELANNFIAAGWHEGFDDYYARRREVYAQLVYAEKDWERSVMKEQALIRAIERRAEAERLNVLGLELVGIGN